MLRSYSTKVLVNTVEVDTSHLRENTNKAKRSKADSWGPPLHTHLKGHNRDGKGEAER